MRLLALIIVGSLVAICALILVVFAILPTEQQDPQISGAALAIVASAVGVLGIVLKSLVDALRDERSDDDDG